MAHRLTPPLAALAAQAMMIGVERAVAGRMAFAWVGKGGCTYGAGPHMGHGHTVHLPTPCAFR